MTLYYIRIHTSETRNPLIIASPVSSCAIMSHNTGIFGQMFLTLINQSRDSHHFIQSLDHVITNHALKKVLGIYIYMLFPFIPS